MQITITVKDGATNTEIAAALRWRANLIDGMEPKAASSVANTSTPGEVKTATKAKAQAAPAPEADDAGDEDFAAAPAKKTSGKKAAAAASFEDEDDSAEEAQTSSEADDAGDDDDFMAEAPKTKAKAKKITVNDVNDACKAKAKASDRKAVLAILKKQFGVTSVTELDQKQYADVIKAMAV